MVSLDRLPATGEGARAAADTVTRSAACARHATAGRWRASQGRLRAARAFQHRVHDGHVLGRHPVTRTSGRRYRRSAVRGRGKVMSETPHPVKWTTGEYLDAQHRARGRVRRRGATDHRRGPRGTREAEGQVTLAPTWPQQRLSRIVGRAVCAGRWGALGGLGPDLRRLVRLHQRLWLRLKRSNRSTPATSC
jgi:hypothetical protein